MLDTLDRLERSAEEALQAIEDASGLGEWRSCFLGRKGRITEAV